jgi:hypothetical protein
MRQSREPLAEAFSGNALSRGDHLSAAFPFKKSRNTDLWTVYTYSESALKRFYGQHTEKSRPPHA